ncbi:TRAP transporter permease [Thermosyntropha sp.]|uniref:TRAP transporter permease n=1 Tax=Thermosyntropha sp. TaxID=2740820 RepID=UPI0025E2EEDD|nr:TRAP transporter permease [Thermosyntropha sp.]MBO8159904.1 TRAP transporter permease [Thermosyntropha sp.]
MHDLNHEDIKIEEFLAQYDRESDFRRYGGFFKLVVAVIAVCFSLFHIYTGIFGTLDAILQRAVHLSFAMALVFLLYPGRKSWSRQDLHLIDGILAVIAAAIPLYIVVFYQELVLRAGMPTVTDIIVGAIGILMVLEAARRVVGWPIVTIAVLFLLYAYAGPYMPGAFAHRGVNLDQIVSHLYFTTEGVFGIPLGVSSTFIFLFILFAAYLEKTGLGQFFIDLANALAGWARGGPAKVAVISSGLMGTISGSSVANVAGTGSLTIPMMKKLGYKPEFAGAVEAAASTGGQLMPPIMGAAAFLMAEFVGVPYIEVVKAAIVPALLYFTGIMLGVHLEARKNGMEGIPRSELPKAGEVLKERGHLAIPLIAIIYLLVKGFSPMKAALWAIALSIVAAMLKPSTRLSLRDIVKGLEDGARSALGVIIACAAAGIIIGVVTKTGLGLKLGSALIDLANGNLLLTLIFTMITSIILGMGVPTTANYVITSTIAAPAVIGLGVPLLAAHMFAFYFGIIADVTPPVALAAFAGSGIARSNPMKTGINAAKLAIAAFIVPYIFVMSPVLLMINAHLSQVLLAVLTAVVGMIGVAAAVSGYFVTYGRFYDRIIFFIGGLLMISPGLRTDILGLGFMLLAYAIQKNRQAKIK